MKRKYYILPGVQLLPRDRGYQRMEKLFVRNMVCDRCKSAVKNALDSLGLAYTSVELGEIETVGSLDADSVARVADALKPLGFELIQEKKARIVSQIKNATLTWVRGERPACTKFSAYLAAVLGKDYSLLSNLFSSVENITIEQYLIMQKVERAKELLVYDELALTGIADQLGYSSPSHLSNQFKKVTGLTPLHFKKIGARRRISLDKV